jgi:hypothetical protein
VGGFQDGGSLTTAWLDRGNSDEVGRQLICFECFHVHLHQADEGTTEIRLLHATPIDDDSGCDHVATVCRDNVDGLLDATSARNDVFRDEETLVRRNGEAAAQDEATIFFLGKNVTFAQRSGNFLANNNATKGGRDDALAVELTKAIGKQAADMRRHVRILQEQRALEKLAAVPAGAEDEMTVEQSAGFAKESQQIVAHFWENLLPGSIADRLTLARDRDGFDFHACAFWERRHLDRGARRRLFSEIGGVNVIHSLEIGEVGQKDGRLNHMLKTQSFGFENSLKIIKNSPRLFADIL